MATSRSASLRNVALDAGVSVSTVSRYFRGLLNVEPATEQKILSAANQLGYKAPKPPTASKKSTLALLVPELSNPFFASLAEAYSTAVAAQHSELVIKVSGKSHEREEVLTREVLLSETIDGLIYVGMNNSNSVLQESADRDFPVVVVDEVIELSTPLDSVVVDNYAGAYQATTYLIRQGHETIAHIAGPPDLHTTKERLKGYKDALVDNGIEIDDQLIFHGPYSEQFGASVFPYLLHAPQPVSAVFAGSDIVAIGVLGTAEMHGYSVPNDISVVGCDGIRVGQWLRPKLTTLEQPIQSIVDVSLNYLMDRIRASAEDRALPPRSNVLPLELVIRGSVKAASHQIPAD